MDSPVNTPDPPIVDPNEMKTIVASCRNCPYFHVPNPPEEGKLMVGECRYSNPTGDGRGMAIWPGTHAALWCGRHPTLEAFKQQWIGRPLPENATIVRGLRIVQKDSAQDPEDTTPKDKAE